jgi:hypothetical protein
MAKTLKFTQDQLDKATEWRDKHSIDREQRAGLILLCIEKTGCSRETAASIFGVDVRTVHDDLERIRNPDTMNKGQWGGGNYHNMTFEEEELFLKSHLDDAEAGMIISVPKLHEEYNNIVGKITPPSTFYRLLKRHNWRKVLPDTRHPKGDPTLQEDFKKKHLKFRWMKFS